MAMQRMTLSGVGFSVMFAALDAMQEGLIDTCEQSLDSSSALVEERLENTTQYNDVTGATRAGSRSYMQSYRNPSVGAAAIADGKAMSEQLNPYSTDDDDPPAPADGEIQIIAATFTNYSMFLNVRPGPQQFFVADALIGQGNAIYGDLIIDLGELFQ